MTVIWIATAVSGLLGLTFIASAVSGGGRASTSVLGGLLGVGLIGVAGVLGAVGANLNTWKRLTREQAVAEIAFEQTGPRAFTATLTRADGETAEYALRGDDWQLDARVIKFPPAANMAGLDALYHLDRLGGRYADVNREVSDERTVYALTDNPGIDLWKIARDKRASALKIDASFGSAVYSPMADGARYEVRMTQSSLVSRPLNDAASTALSRWDGRDEATATDG